MRCAHVLDGCLCTRCGDFVHDWRYEGSTEEYSGTNAYHGAYIDVYTQTTTLKCTRCGETKEDVETVSR